MSFRYVRDLITLDDVLNLAMNAGMIVGVGDGRQERGAFSFGSWDVVSHDHPEWMDIVEKEGREAQLAALDDPSFADEESADLLGWYDAEVMRRRDPVTRSRSSDQPEQPGAST
jgi:hypothetical protein